MPKRDAAVLLAIVIVVAVVAFLFLGTDISVYLEQHPPDNAL